MTLILAIDAAWTDTEPSGVALLTASGPRWTCLCVAPSYNAFSDYARGTHIDWATGNFRGSKPDIHELLRAARTIGGSDDDLVAVDMPITTVPSRPTGRRQRDLGCLWRARMLRSFTKRYEDALDALVCGWVAARFVQGNSMPYGGATAAVWVPKADGPSTTLPGLLRDVSV